jgi:hypothetical protein
MPRLPCHAFVAGLHPPSKYLQYLCTRARSSVVAVDTVPDACGCRDDVLPPVSATLTGMLRCLDRLWLLPIKDVYDLVPAISFLSVAKTMWDACLPATFASTPSVVDLPPSSEAAEICHRISTECTTSISRLAVFPDTWADVTEVLLEIGLARRSTASALLPAALTDTNSLFCRVLASDSLDSIAKTALTSRMQPLLSSVRSSLFASKPPERQLHTVAPNRVTTSSTVFSDDDELPDCTDADIEPFPALIPTPSLQPGLFVGLRLYSPRIHRMVKHIQREIVSQEPKLGPAVEAHTKLHLTFAVVKTASPAAVELAKQVKAWLSSTHINPVFRKCFCMLADSGHS